MKHIQILKRAWSILWSYKTLWVFGILLALTMGESSVGPRFQGNLPSDTRQVQTLTPQEIDQLPENIRDGVLQVAEWMTPPFPRETVNTVIGIAVALLCLALVIAVVCAFVHYVGQTALVRMVDRFEATGEKANWRAGFRLGWSRSAWRLFLIDVLIFLAGFVFVVLLFAFAALPLLLTMMLGGLAVIAGMLLTVGLGMLAIFATIIAGAAVIMAREMIYRECVLGGKGVLESIRSGVQVLRTNFKDVFLLYLLLLAIQIIYIVAAVPVTFLLLALGLVVGGIAGALLYLALQGASVLTAIVVAVIVGILLFAAVVGLPMLFLRGLRETYLSTAWTLGYRELPVSAAEGNPS
jgi:hypothetical protein